MRILFVALFCLLTSCAAANQGGDVLQLQIVHYSGSTFKCTAFLIAPDVALTAGHCFRPCRNGACVSRLLAEDGGIYQVEFADFSNVSDYASTIIQPKEGANVWPISEKRPRVGDMACYTTTRPGEEWTEKCGDISEIQFGRATIGMPIAKGTSGAPVYNTDYEVIGIAIEMKERDGQETVAQLINPVVTYYGGDR